MRKRTAGPQTAAERQRAYRERKKAQRDSLEVTQPAAGEDPAADPELGEVSVAELNARMRQMAAQSLHELGGVEYLTRVAKKAPNTYLRYIGQFVTKDEQINPGAFNIYVQKLTIENATPVRGVIASPVAGHVSGERLMLPPALVVEEGDDA